MRFQLVATCLFGLEHMLGEEIDALGYERVSTIDGRVTFFGDCEAVALSNIFLRYAERAYISEKVRIAILFGFCVRLCR
jgi:putative N6-adenine-specific DNA methylase